MVGERLLAYGTAGAGDDVQRLLFAAGAQERDDPGGRGVWAARLRPSPVLFGEGVRVPGDKARFVDVTPPEKSPAELVVDAFFVDSDHGWVLLADSEDKGHRLLFTTDGGGRWAASLLDTGADTPRWLFFVDREHGWMAAHPATRGSRRPQRSTGRPMAAAPGPARRRFPVADRCTSTPCSTAGSQIPASKAAVVVVWMASCTKPRTGAGPGPSAKSSASRRKPPAGSTFATPSPG